MASGPPADDGCYILLLTGGFVLAGAVRHKHSDGVERLEVETADAEVGSPRIAVVSPQTVLACIPCSDGEAKLMSAALQQSPLTPRQRPHAG